MRESERRKLAKVRRGQNRRISGGKVIVTPKGQSRRVKDPFPSKPGTRLSPSAPRGKGGPSKPAKRRPPKVVHVPNKTLTNALKRGYVKPGEVKTINKIIQAQDRSLMDLRLRERRLAREARQEEMFRKRKGELLGARQLSPLALGGQFRLPNLRQRVSRPITAGKRLDLSTRPGSEFMRTEKDFVVSAKEFARLGRRAMTPEERKAYDAANRRQNVQAILTAVSLLPVGPTPALLGGRAGRALARGAVKVGTKGGRAKIAANVAQRGRDLKMAKQLLKGQGPRTLARAKLAARAERIGKAGTRLGRLKAGTTARTVSAPIRRPRATLGTAAVSPVLAEAPIGAARGKRPSLKAALEGRGQLAALTGIEAGGKGVLGTLGNFGADLINLPAQMIPSIYIPIVAAVAYAHGDKQRWRDLIKALKETDPAGALILAGDPEKAVRNAQRHPLFAALEAAGAYGAVGRGAGFGMRRSGIRALEEAASRERAPITFPGRELVVEQRYSPNIITKQAQKALERRGIGPLRDTRLGRAIHMIGTEQLAVRRMERSSRNVVIRHVEDIIRAARDFNIGHNQEAVAMAVQNILRPTSIDRMQADAGFLTELWSQARTHYADGTQAAALIDANLEALARVRSDPEFAARVAQAAAAFKRTQTPHEMALIEAEAIEALRALRRSELPAAILYRNVRYVPEAGRFEQFGGPEEPPAATPPGTPPSGGGGGPGRLPPSEPMGPVPPGRELGGPPSLRERVEAGFGPLAGPEQVRIMAENIRRYQQGEIPIGQRSAAIRRMREGHITTPHDPELERFWNEIDPNGEIRQYYLQQDTYRPERLSEPVDLDAAAEALGKTDDEVAGDIRDYMGEERGGGLGTYEPDDPIRQNNVLSEAERARDDADEFNLDTASLDNAIHEYEQGFGSLDSIESEILDLRELIDEARPISKDEIAQYLHEVEQMPEAFRREPKPSPGMVERPKGMTHDEFMQHYQDRSKWGKNPYNDINAERGTPEESRAAVDEAGLMELIQEMADPFNTQPGHSIIARLAQERNWTWATFRIAQSMVNYHQWVEKLPYDKAAEFVRLERGEPILGQADRARLKDVIDELEFERSLPKESQNPSYIGRLIRNVAEASQDPTLKQIHGLPEVARDPMYKAANEALEVARELRDQHKRTAARDPHSPTGTAWRALNNAIIRAERGIKNDALSPSAVQELQTRSTHLEDEVQTSRELGDFGLTPDFPELGAKPIRDMTLDELKTERGDWVDELRASEVAGDDTGKLHAQRNINAIDQELAVRQGKKIDLHTLTDEAAVARAAEVNRRIEASEHVEDALKRVSDKDLMDSVLEHQRAIERATSPEQAADLHRSLSKVTAEIERRAREKAPEKPQEAAGGPPVPPEGGGQPPAPPGGRGPEIGPLYEPPGGPSRPISTGEMVRQREAAGEPRPGFLSGRLTGVSAGAEAGKPFVSGRVKGGQATGKTWLEGLQPGDITTMVQTIMGQRGYAERVNLHRALGEQLGMRDENGVLLKTGNPEKFAREYDGLVERGLLDPNEDYDLIKALPEKNADPETMAQLRDAVNNDTATPADVMKMLNKGMDEGDPTALDLGTFLDVERLDEFLGAKTGSAPQGYWIVTKKAASQYKDLMSARLMDPATRFARGWQAAFKSAVLPTSTKWIAGNFFDVTMRALLAGIAPPGLVHLDPRFHFMKELKKVMEDIDKEAANAWFASLGLRGHYGSQGVVPRITGREGLKLRQNMRDLVTALATARVKPTARNMIDLYSRYRDTVYHLNTKHIEETPQFAFLGKLAKQELRQRMKHWDMTNKTYEDALRDFARGLLKTRKQEYFAERLARQFGDWSTLGPVERRWLVNYAPFYLWARAATKFVLVTLPRDHPVFTSLAAVANSMTQEERRTFGFDLLYKKGAGVLPRFLQGGVPVGKKESKYGIKGLAYATTFGVWADYPNALASFILPQANSALWAGSGLDFTGEHITNGDGTPITAAQKAGLVAYFLAEPLIPFAAMGRTMLRGDREHRGWFPLTGYKGDRKPFGVVAGHALIPSPLPGSKTYPKGLTDYLRWRQTHAQQIWVPIKGGRQAPGRGVTEGVGKGSEGVGGGVGAGSKGVH